MNVSLSDVKVAVLGSMILKQLSQVNPSSTDFGGRSLVASRMQIQKVVSLKEGGYVRRRDPDWPGPQNPTSPSGTFSLFSMFKS